METKNRLKFIWAFSRRKLNQNFLRSREIAFSPSFLSKKSLNSSLSQRSSFQQWTLMCRPSTQFGLRTPLLLLKSSTLIASLLTNRRRRLSFASSSSKVRDAHSETNVPMPTVSTSSSRRLTWPQSTRWLSANLTSRDTVLMATDVNLLTWTTISQLSTICPDATKCLSTKSPESIPSATSRLTMLNSLSGTWLDHPRVPLDSNALEIFAEKRRQILVRTRQEIRRLSRTAKTPFTLRTNSVPWLWAHIE